MLYYLFAPAGLELAWEWAVWLWSHVGGVFQFFIGLLVFMRLWRIQGVRSFLATVTGVAELQGGNIKLLQEQVKLLGEQKQFAEESRDEFKGKWEAAVLAAAAAEEEWAEQLAAVQRECDGRRRINDQDTLVIELYERLHGTPPEVEALIEQRRLDAITRAAERKQRDVVESGTRRISESGARQLGRADRN